MKKVGFFTFLILAFFIGARGQEPILYGDRPAITKHLAQEDIESGKIPLPVLFKAGEDLFNAEFNRLDGVAPRVGGNFNRVIGPDTQSCADCHFKPVIGGGGPNAANVFAVPSDPSRTDLADPRNSNHLFGSGSLEMLGIEMSQRLLALEREARTESKQKNQPVTVRLVVKGVDFGSLTAHPDGTSDKSKVVGIDRNLILKPFSRKGIVRTIRQFTLNASNLHFGIQAVEVAGSFIDASGDGLVNKLTVGDVSALTAWQASLPIPVRRKDSDSRLTEVVQKGEHLFGQIGCADCHRPKLTLNRPIFRLPNPRDGSNKMVLIDLTRDTQPPRLSLNPDGSADVPLFSDLKRHDMGERLAETFIQSGVERPFFITTPLWGTGNTGPWLHDGRATTLDDSIRWHGGEGEASRKAYESLPENERRMVVEFLRSLILSTEQGDRKK